MRIQDVEIPLNDEKSKRYRFFEILPGLLSWSMLAFPFVLSQISAQLTALFILAFFLMWFARAIGLNVRVIQGWRQLKRFEKMHWQPLLDDLQNLELHTNSVPKWHANNINRLSQDPTPVKPRDIYHVMMIAVYNETKEIVAPTIESVLDMDYDMKKVIVVIAYEERGGKEVEAMCNKLVKQYGKRLYSAVAIKHPDGIPNEIRGKGGNITYAGHELKTYLEKQKIDPINTIVTTLDADNRPHKNYLAVLSYMYASCKDPEKYSFQPIPIYSNNIWDVPAPMRVIATGNSFWNIVLSMRPHMIRNFSSHAQGMKALIDTDFWSVRTIVEDGHQFWRTYFRYDGEHIVLPMYIPIYQDAVLDVSYRKTLRMQFVQLRRWAWGASDIAYVAEKGFFTKNKISKVDVMFKFLRLLEGHISWATAPLILALAAFIPLLFNPQDFTANQLPIIASRIQTVAMVGIIVTLFLSFKALPPKPKRYKSHRNIFMILQWVLLPVTSIGYSSLSALNSQTRLMFKLYLGSFDVTTKHVKADKK